MVLALAACGGASGTSKAEQEVLRVGHVTGLGSVLVDPSGKTLYEYVPDHQGLSRCTGRCAVQWPPLLVTRPPTRAQLGPGVDPALVRTDRRADGSLQVTYDGWPLYTYLLDGSPGEAIGQEDDMGLWDAMSPDGHAIA
jgi:predicted lipoprotein with Yx(FWY)xxD motif